MATLVGIDLAWLSHRNPTAIAWGEVRGIELRLSLVVEELFGTAALTGQLEAGPKFSGVAVDAPLIINNSNGLRSCEKDIGREYSGRKAACHPSNLERYPDADSVALAHWLERAGHRHLGPRSGKWQLECYPHPAIIEIFGLPERHLYKKGKVAVRTNGQVQFANMLLALSRSRILRLTVDSAWAHYFDEDYIRSLRGRALKHNEDILDSVLCLYIAGLCHFGIAGKVFGDTSEGYIYVPDRICI